MTKYIVEDGIADFVGRYPLPSKNILGHASQTDDGIIMIVYNSLLDNPNDPRKGFTLCHEVGHVALHHPINEYSCP